MRVVGSLQRTGQPARPTAVAAQFGGMLATRVGGAALLAVLGVLFARTVGPPVFGAFSVVTGIALPVLALGDFGVGASLARARAQTDAALVATLVGINRWTSVLSVAVLGTGVWLLAPSAIVGPLVLYAAALGMEKFADTALSLWVGVGNQRIPAVSIVGRRVVALVVFGALLAAGTAPEWAYSLGFVAGSLAAAVQVAVLGARIVRDIAEHADARWALRGAVPFMVANLTTQARALDVPIVAAVSGATAAGIYSAALRVVNAAYLIPSSLNIVLMPHVARGGTTYARRAARRLALLSAGFLVLALVVAAVSEPIVRLVFGPAFLGAAPVLAALVIGLPLVSLAAGLGAVLQGVGFERQVAVNGVVFAVVTLALVAVGVVAWGPTGAAYGIAVASLLKAASLGFVIRTVPVAVPSA